MKTVTAEDSHWNIGREPCAPGRDPNKRSASVNSALTNLDAVLVPETFISGLNHLRQHNVRALLIFITTRTAATLERLPFILSVCAFSFTPYRPMMTQNGAVLRVPDDDTSRKSNGSFLSSKTRFFARRVCGISSEYMRAVRPVTSTCFKAPRFPRAALPWRPLLQSRGFYARCQRAPSLASSFERRKCALSFSTLLVVPQGVVVCLALDGTAVALSL